MRHTHTAGGPEGAALPAQFFQPLARPPEPPWVHFSLGLPVPAHEWTPLALLLMQLQESLGSLNKHALGTVPGWPGACLQGVAI